MVLYYLKILLLSCDYVYEFSLELIFEGSVSIFLWDFIQSADESTNLVPSHFENDPSVNFSAYDEIAFFIKYNAI